MPPRGVFAAGAAAWAVLGARGAGKSSLLAWLASRGQSIVADDVAIVDGRGDVFAGPRSLDLRADAAAELGLGTPLGRLGQRERWRVALEPIAAALPLAGWIALDWGSDSRTTPVAARDRLRLLAAHRAVRLEPPDPGLLLRLAALPGWSSTLPRDWAALHERGERLLAVAAEGGPAAPATPPGAG